MVPVLPKGELEVLLEAAVDLSKKGECRVGMLSIVCAAAWPFTALLNTGVFLFHIFSAFLPWLWCLPRAGVRVLWTALRVFVNCFT